MGEGGESTIKNVVLRQKTHVEMGGEREEEYNRQTTHLASQGRPSYIPQQSPHLITLDYPPYVH